MTNIGERAFADCLDLISIVISDNNPKYDSRDNCNAIIETSTNTLLIGCQNTIIPNSVTSIGNRSFYGCSGLLSVTIPNSITSIGDAAFFRCESLTAVTIPSSVKSIGNYAFRDCSGLASATFGYGVMAIGSYAFYNCTSLQEVTIPTGLKTIGEQAFQNCNNIKRVNISDMEGWLKIKFMDNRSNPTHFSECLYLNGVEVTDVVVPASITVLGDNQFKGLKNLKTIIMHDGITRLPKSVLSSNWAMPTAIRPLTWQTWWLSSTRFSANRTTRSLKRNSQF